MPANDRSRPRKSRRRRSDRSEGTISILTRLLSARHGISLNGERQTVTVVEAIILQLMQRAFAGDRRARRVMLRYEQFSRRHQGSKLTLRYVDNDYTRASVDGSP